MTVIPGSGAGSEQLSQFIERVERLEEEKRYHGDEGDVSGSDHPAAANPACRDRCDAFATASPQ